MIFEAVLVVAFVVSWMVTIAVNSNQCLGLPMSSIGSALQGGRILIQARSLPFMSLFLILFNKIVWSTLSKALLKSHHCRYCQDIILNKIALLKRIEKNLLNRISYPE